MHKLFPLATNFRPIIAEMMKNSQGHHKVSDENVYQEGNKGNLKLVYQISDPLMLPGSGIFGLENLQELYHRAQSGKACLILMEHYSNFDLPAFYSQVEHSGPEGAQIADALVAMAGAKLNEEHPLVLAFAEAFTRIVIYPSRSIEALPDGPEKEAELARANKINMAAMKALFKAKSSGKIVLVFPAGTRYREGRPETKRGVKEIDSYLKLFDHMVLVSINGNILVRAENDDMSQEVARTDVIQYQVSPLIDCADFRKKAQEETPEGADPKQFTVDRIMERLDSLHQAQEPLRLQALRDNGFQV